MSNSIRNVPLVILRNKIKAKCDTLLVGKNQIGNLLDSDNNLRKLKLIDTNKHVRVITKQLRYFDELYESLIGVKKLRDIQNEVLWWEDKNLDISRQRKLRQAELNSLNDRLSITKEKIGNISCLNEIHDELVAELRRLTSERNTVQDQLDRILEDEDLTSKKLSQLLRKSHEYERNRFERSKTTQLILLIINLIGGTIWALQDPSQKGLQDELQRSQAVTGEILEKVEQLSSTVREIKEISNQPSTSSSNGGWLGYIPGATTVCSWLRII